MLDVQKDTTFEARTQRDLAYITKSHNALVHFTKSLENQMRNISQGQAWVSDSEAGKRKKEAIASQCLSMSVNTAH